MNASKALSRGQRPGGQAVPIRGDHYSLLLLKATPSFSVWLPGGASGLGPQSRVWRWHLRQPGRFHSPRARKPDRNKAKQTQRGHRTRPDPPANRPFLTQHTTDRACEESGLLGATGWETLWTALGPGWRCNLRQPGQVFTYTTHAKDGLGLFKTQ